MIMANGYDISYYVTEGSRKALVWQLTKSALSCIGEGAGDVLSGKMYLLPEL